MKYSKNFDFGQIFEKISLLVKFRIISILDKIYENFENFDFGQNLWKFRKILILVKFSKNFAFGHKFRFPSKIWKKFRISEIFEKYGFWSNLRKNLDFGQNFRKFRKFPISVKFSKKFDFGQIFEKISIYVKFFEKFRCWFNFPKNFFF